MSYVFVNEDMKFLSTLNIKTHTGVQMSIRWVEKDFAEVFLTDNLAFEFKKRGANPFNIKNIVAKVVSSFKVELIRTVKILRDQS